MNAFTTRQPTITISGIPTDFASFGYEVIVYLGNNETGSPVDLFVDGTLERDNIQIGPSSYRTLGGYIECGDNNTGPCNFVRSSIVNATTLVVQIVASGGNENAGISGIQLVPWERRRRLTPVSLWPRWNRHLKFGLQTFAAHRLASDRQAV